MADSPATSFDFCVPFILNVVGNVISYGGVVTNCTFNREPGIANRLTRSSAVVRKKVVHLQFFSCMMNHSDKRPLDGKWLTGGKRGQFSSSDSSFFILSLFILLHPWFSGGRRAPLVFVFYRQLVVRVSSSSLSILLQCRPETPWERNTREKMRTEIVKEKKA